MNDHMTAKMRRFAQALVALAVVACAHSAVAAPDIQHWTAASGAREVSAAAGPAPVRAARTGTSPPPPPPVVAQPESAAISSASIPAAA